MAVNHPLFERLGMVQELIPNPDHVVVRLFAQRHARSEPGVNEPVAALIVIDGQRPHERQVLGRQGAGEIIPDKLRRPAGSGIDTIGHHGLTAAVAEPDADFAPGIVEELQQMILVIALEANMLETIQRLPAHRVQNGRRVRAAINVITQIHDHPAARISLAVIQNPVVQLAQQVDPAVNIADGIDPRVRGHAKGRAGMRIGFS